MIYEKVTMEELAYWMDRGSSMFTGKKGGGPIYYNAKQNVKCVPYSTEYEETIESIGGQLSDSISAFYTYIQTEPEEEIDVPKYKATTIDITKIDRK